MIEQSALSPWVKERAVSVFHRIALAEGKVHGLPPEKVHFHEVGAVDSIVDIVGSCICLELLGKPRILSAPVVEGTGWVDCAHGRFPIPSTATLEILGQRGISVTQSEEPHELVTPTGAALLAEFAESFGLMRGLAAKRVGYGLGTRDNKTRPNVLRAILAEEISVSHDWETDEVAVLETNLDDTTPEIVGHLSGKILDSGALDVFTVPVVMKKNRPGMLLTVLCASADADLFTELLLRESSAFGVRRHFAERRKLRREIRTVSTPFGGVEVKVGWLDGKMVQCSPEYESCRKASEKSGAAMKEVWQAALRAAE